MIEYGCVENVDVISFSQKSEKPQGNETTYTDHAIKLDMAKEVSMLQRNKNRSQSIMALTLIYKDNILTRLQAADLILYSSF